MMPPIRGCCCGLVQKQKVYRKGYRVQVIIVNGPLWSFRIVNIFTTGRLEVRGENKENEGNRVRHTATHERIDMPGLLDT